MFVTCAVLSNGGVKWLWEHLQFVKVKLLNIISIKSSLKFRESFVVHTKWGRASQRSLGGEFSDAMAWNSDVNKHVLQFLCILSIVYAPYAIYSLLAAQASGRFYSSSFLLLVLVLYLQYFSSTAALWAGFTEGLCAEKELTETERLGNYCRSSSTRGEKCGWRPSLEQNNAQRE